MDVNENQIEDNAADNTLINRKRDRNRKFKEKKY